MEELRALLEHPQAIAVGETGLDYFHDFAPRQAQRWLFENQLALASDLALPVVIHTRDARGRHCSAPGRLPGLVVLHCFSAPALLDVAIDRGYYVSFAGNVTFPKAPELREAAARVPADRILAETDSPYLAPQPVRGKHNEPANVLHTLAFSHEHGARTWPSWSAASTRTRQLPSRSRAVTASRRRSRSASTSSPTATSSESSAGSPSSTRQTSCSKSGRASGS